LRLKSPNPEPKNWPEHETPITLMPPATKDEALKIASWINSLRAAAINKYQNPQYPAGFFYVFLTLVNGDFIRNDNSRWKMTLDFNIILLCVKPAEVLTNFHAEVGLRVLDL
jgi:hypothetical protein